MSLRRRSRGGGNNARCALSDEFNASIEAKVKAEYDALRAENEKIRRITATLLGVRH